jgi:hypothetical protein
MSQGQTWKSSTTLLGFLHVVKEIYAFSRGFKCLTDLSDLKVLFVIDIERLNKAFEEWTKYSC